MSHKHDYNNFNFAIIRRCLYEAIRFSPWMFGGMFFLQLCLTLSSFVQIGSIGLIVDRLVAVTQDASALGNLWQYVVLYMAALALPIIFQTIFNHVDTIFFRKFSDAMKLRFITKTSQLDIQVIEDGTFQNQKSKALEQGEYSTYVVAEYGMFLVINIVSISTAIIFLAYFNWRYAVLAFLAAIPSFLVEFFHGKRVYGSWDEDTQDRRIYENRVALLTRQDAKNSVVEIRLFGNIKHFINLISEFLYTFQRKIVGNERKRIKDEIIGNGIYISSYVGALYLVIQDVLSKVLSIGSFSVALGSFEILSTQLGKMFGNIARISRYSQYAKDWFSIMDTQNILAQPDRSVAVTIEASAPVIEFKNVWFKYPGSDTWIFQNLNLAITAGTKVALVGHNGAGKTTFVHLLLRIYDPTRGCVTINGIDLKDIDLDSYYANTAALMQEFAVFKFPVRQAIALGDTSVAYDEDRMLAAARASHAYSFIERWEEGYDAMIGREFDGKELSGGERQRMAIARVFYRNAGLVILDEPTSAVDAIAEQEIFESVYNSGKQQTILTISHRFSTVKKSDIIVVLEHGAVVEMGSHHELIARLGRYNELYTAQASAYSD